MNQYIHMYIINLFYKFNYYNINIENSKFKNYILVYYVGALDET